MFIHFMQTMFVFYFPYSMASHSTLDRLAASMAHDEADLSQSLNENGEYIDHLEDSYHDYANPVIEGIICDNPDDAFCKQCNFSLNDFMCIQCTVQYGGDCDGR